MSILCRFVEWYLDYADKPEQVPVVLTKHVQTCRHCHRQLNLSGDIRSITKQAFTRLPEEPFGGFKPLAVRPSMATSPAGFVISPGLWVGSLVAAVVLAVVGTDYSHREIFSLQPSAMQKTNSQQAVASVDPQMPLFSMDELKAFMPTPAETAAAPKQSKGYQHVAAKPMSTRKSGLVAVPVMPVRSRIVDRQLMASVQMLSGPTINEQQDSLRSSRPPVTLRPSATQTMAMMTKSVAIDVQSIGTAELQSLGAGAGGGANKPSIRVSDVTLGSSAMAAVPMESRGIPTESGLSL
ncbi:MAG: hypothetical protein ACYC1M_17085 [Armatimonadota bacterium]